MDTPNPYTQNLSAFPELANRQLQNQTLQRSQAETQQQQLRNQQEQDLNKFSGEMANYLTSDDSRGRAFHELPTQTQQGILKSYPTITQHIPDYWNAAQRAATGNQDIGVPKSPEGVIENVNVGPDGKTSRSFQRDTSNPTGIQEGGELPAYEEKMAQAMAEYRFPYQSLSRLQGPQKLRILDRISQLNPDFDANQYQARQGVMRSFASGQDAANIASANTVIGHLAEMLKAGEELHNSSFTPYNYVANKLQGVTGNPNQTRFASASTAVADELAKLFKGTGAATDQTIKDWKATINPSMSPAQIRASAEEAMGLMQSRLDALKEKYISAMGKEPPSFISPNAQRILQTIGIGQQAQPQGQPQLSQQDQQAINWARQNPQDPRSGQILAIHGLR